MTRATGIDGVKREIDNLAAARARVADTMILVMPETTRVIAIVTVIATSGLVARATAGGMRIVSETDRGVETTGQMNAIGNVNETADVVATASFCPPTEILRQLDLVISRLAVVPRQ